MAGKNYLAMIDENYCSRATQNNRFSYNYLVLWTIKKHPQNCLRKYILSILFELFISAEKNNRNKNIYWKSCSFVSKYVFSCSLGQEKSSFCNIIPSRFPKTRIYAFHQNISKPIKIKQIERQNVILFDQLFWCCWSWFVNAEPICVCERLQNGI